MLQPEFGPALRKLRKAVKKIRALPYGLQDVMEQSAILIKKSKTYTDRTTDLVTNTYAKAPVFFGDTWVFEYGAYMYYGIYVAGRGFMPDNPALSYARRRFNQVLKSAFKV